jgi:hypothetical protein
LLDYFNNCLDLTWNILKLASYVFFLQQAIFQRYPWPEMEYQSFSLIHGNEERSVDVVVVHALKLHLATQVSPVL